MGRSIALVIILILFLSPRSASAIAQQVCVRIVWFVSSGGVLAAQQESDNETFVKINGKGISTSVLRNSILPSGARSSPPTAIATYSESYGCTSRDVIKEGQNQINVDLIWPSCGDQYNEEQCSKIVFNLFRSGYGQATVKIEVGNNSLTICDIYSNANTGISHACQVTKTFTLDEIDPEFSAEISRLKAQISGLRNQINALNGDVEKMRNLVQALKNKFNELTGMDFDNISESNFVGYENELQEALTILKSTRSDLGTLTNQANTLFRETNQKMSEVREATEKKINDQGINVDLINWDLPGIDNIELPPSPDIPDVDKFDINNDPYGKNANILIEELQKSYSVDNRVALLESTYSWLRTTEALKSSLENRAQISPKEYAAFKKSIDKVHRFLFFEGCDGQGCFTEGFWFKDSPVPAEVRTIVDHELTTLDKQKAQNLKRTLSTWGSKENTEDHKKVLNTIIYIGSAVRTLPRLPIESRNPLEKYLKKILGQAVSATKIVSKVAIGFTFLGDFIDLYEVCSGKDFYTNELLSPWQRALTGFGMVIGSGKVWRSIGEEIPTVGRLGREIDEIADGVRESVEEITKILTPNKLRKYLNNVEDIPRKTLIADMESIGLKLSGESPDGRFMTFADSKGKLRAQIHPPDSKAKTPFNHLHIYNEKGETLSKALEVVSRRSMDAHIRISEP